jgi:hypothetical protein
MLENEVDRVLEIAKAADMKAIFCPYLDEIAVRIVLRAGRMFGSPSGRGWRALSE